MVRQLFEVTRPARVVEAEQGELDDETKDLLEELGYMGVDDNDGTTP